MRAVVFRGVGDVRVEDVPDPSVEERDDAVIRITAAAICGSDLHFYHGRAPMLPGDALGHEGIGVVEDVGEDIESIRPGDRVVPAFDIVCGACWFCRRGETALCDRFRNLGAGTAAGGLGGTHADRVRVPHAHQNLLKVPDGLEDERALFLGDILTTAVYAAASARIREGDTVAVIGAGPVGLLCAQAARVHGPAEVLVCDVDAERLALAEAMGAVPVDVTRQNAEMAAADRTDGRGADVVIEAVGAVAAFESSLDVVRRGGTICVVGMYTVETIELSLGRSWLKGLKIIFAGVSPIHAWWNRALEAVQEGAIDPLPIISHTLPLEEAPKGYELFDSREATKVVLKP